jgi:hypothetical protein
VGLVKVSVAIATPVIPLHRVGGSSPAAVEIITRSGDTILTRSGDTIIARTS